MAQSFILAEHKRRPHFAQKDVVSILILVNILGRICEKHEEFIKAAGHFQLVLQGRKKELGDNHPATLQSEHYLARVLLAQEGGRRKACRS